eukprot:g5540.t1
MQSLAAAGLEDFSHINQYLTLLDYKNAIMKTEVGPGKSIWADDYAIRYISNQTMLTYLIISNSNSRRGSMDYIIIRPEKVTEENRYVVLHRTRRSHYNLVKVNGKSSLQDDSLPSHFYTLWPELKEIKWKNEKSKNEVKVKEKENKKKRKLEKKNEAQTETASGKRAKNEV